jgi:chemotaxis signal transduction protein
VKATAKPKTKAKAREVERPMTQRDLLCCKLADVHVAVPLERVIGVAEGGLVTPLPYSAPSFEGLVEVFGQVMPQVNLASLLALGSSASSILVVVSDRGGSLALRVLHVSGMIQVDGDRLAPTAARARALHPLYMAEVEHQGLPHYVLDLDLLATSDALELSGPDGAVLLPEARPEGRTERAEEQEWLPLLLLEIAGERYAIPNRSIIELNVTDGIRSMPSAPNWILGLIDVRGTPIVAVSTAVLLGRPPVEGHAPDVCLISELEPGFPVALFVDRAIGLERVSPSLIHPMQQAMVGVSGYFVLHDDEIVGLIDPKLLLSQVAPTLRAAVPQQPVAQETSRAEELGQYQQLLSLRVGRELYAMTLDRIERIEASVRLTPLPSHIAYFDGLADVGDAVVPVIDLRRQQGTELQPFDSSERPPCILTLLEGSMTGILVDQVLSIVDIQPERFEPVREASRLPISHVVTYESQLIALLTIDRLLPRSTKTEAQSKQLLGAPK